MYVVNIDARLDVSAVEIKHGMCYLFVHTCIYSIVYSIDFIY